jgi:hypothetical protein
VKSLGLGFLLLAGAWPARPLQEPARAPSRLERVVEIGASLSAGFGAERPFADVLAASLRAPRPAPLALGSELFFTAPLASAKRQVGSALDAEPTLVVAIDFLFWFGYGTIDAQGGAIELESERLALLEQGLDLLEEFECPLVVGDFPDMSAAVGRMLAPAQMPEKTTLPLLSKRVREWAAAREHTYVLPISEVAFQLASAARTGKELRIGRHAFPAGARLLQSDQLHPTLEGLAAVAQLLCDQLVAAELVPAEEFELEWAAVMQKLGRVRARAPVPAGG